MKQLIHHHHRVRFQKVVVQAAVTVAVKKSKRRIGSVHDLDQTKNHIAKKEKKKMIQIQDDYLCKKLKK